MIRIWRLHNMHTYNFMEFVRNLASGFCDVQLQLQCTRACACFVAPRTLLEVEVKSQLQCSFCILAGRVWCSQLFFAPTFFFDAVLLRRSTTCFLWRRDAETVCNLYYIQSSNGLSATTNVSTWSWSWSSCLRERTHTRSAEFFQSETLTSTDPPNSS